MEFYIYFVQRWCILVTFSFDFGAIKSLPKNFGLFEMAQDFKNLDLAIAKVEKVNISDI